MINNNYKTKVYNFSNRQIQDSLFLELKNGLWKDFKIENYLINSKIPAHQPHKVFDVFDNFKIIPPGVNYDVENDKLKEEIFLPKYQKTSKKDLYNSFENYFSNFKGNTIGVHLSGGLDSSIIIGMLNHFDIPFYLIGLVSHRFEFRTEKKIQEILAPSALETILLDMDDYPFFSELDKKPLSQIPDDNIKQIEGSKAIIESCKKLGVDTVFTGQGGDSIFVDAIPDNNTKWSCNIGSEFIMDYESNEMYPEEGLELLSPFADKKIIEAVYNLRFGQKEDVLKIWARQLFKEILPKELSGFTYCADFFGTSMSGLHIAKSEIDALFKVAYQITQHHTFSPKETARFLKLDVFDFEYQDYIDYCDKISLATWYNGLLREGYVK
jgi:asparagine synthetase B (glutamine-hydrolysing)